MLWWLIEHHNFFLFCYGVNRTKNVSSYCIVLLCFIIFPLTFYVKNIGPLFGTDVRHPRTTLPELAYEWVYIVEQFLWSLLYRLHLACPVAVHCCYLTSFLALNSVHSAVSWLGVSGQQTFPEQFTEIFSKNKLSYLVKDSKFQETIFLFSFEPKKWTNCCCFFEFCPSL